MFGLIERDIKKPQKIENFTFDSQENNILLDLTNCNGSNKTPTRKRSINNVYVMRNIFLWLENV